jgi:hypothetical protein
MLAEAQSDRQFFMAQLKIVRREITGKIAFIVAGPSADGTFEQPLANPIFPATAKPADLAQQGRNVKGIAQPSGQRRAT